MSVVPFKIQPRNVGKNMWEGRSLRILPAVQPDGSPAVALFLADRLLLVLHQEHAISAANRIVDVLEEGTSHG